MFSLSCRWRLLNSVGLALLLLLHRRFQTLDADAVSKMRG